MFANPLIRSAVGVFALFVLTACGGGGGGSGGGNAGGNTPPPPPPAPAPPTGAELAAASLLGSQATFGLTYDEIYAVAELGPDTWLDREFAKPVTRHLPVVDQLFVMLNNDELPEVDNDIQHIVQFRRYAWWNRTMTADDELRQKVAYALSQIFVISDNVELLNVYPAATATYYDMLLENSFGNFRQLLEDVTLHPSMGVYLSHINNARANPANNTFPDENFAREVMQLFTIGLFELNPDGSWQLDAQGQPIPTYDNGDIQEMAKIFTGLSYGGDDAEFGGGPINFRTEMEMFDSFHEPGEKRLLNGVVVPAGQTGLEDISSALDNLFNHPNVGPFIGKQLIQRLVTSNPSPEYVERVTAAFNGDVTGVRGDMRAVIRAILTDAEAQAPATDSSGRLREPLLRFISMARQLHASAEDGLFYNNGYLQQFFLRQHPLSSPSVFNFYQPGHSPAGELSAAGLVGPEFQITDASTVVNMTNLIWFAVFGNFVMDIEDHFGEVTIDLTEYQTLAADSPDALMDRLDLVFMHGQMEPATRAAIVDVFNEVVAVTSDTNIATQTAIYMLLASADYAVDG